MNKIIKPEQKIAIEILKRTNLSPPINIYKLVEKYADIEELDFPVNIDIDAVQLKASSKRRRPLIILNKSKHILRRKFTLAHELGHTLIPWHMGWSIDDDDISCNINYNTKANNSFEKSEIEANAFASELLIPSQWVNNIITSNYSFTKILGFVIEESKVSLSASCIAVLKNMPPGYIIFITDNKNNIKFQAKSNGTLIRSIAAKKLNFLDSFVEFSEESGTVTMLEYTIYWFRFKDYYINNQLEHFDTKTSTDILREIISESIIEENERQKALYSINGIIGSLKSKIVEANLPVDKHNIYKYLEIRKLSHPDSIRKIKSVFEHKDFNLFLEKKIDELSKNRKN